MYVAIDIGGTKTLVAVFSKDKKIVEQVKFPTNHDYELFKIDLAKTVAKLSTTDFLRAAVAIPGVVDRAHGIGRSFGNLPWENVHIARDIERIIDCPVVVENDAKLAGLYEGIEFQDKYKEVLYVTISTGVGIGFTRNGVIDQEISDGGGKAMIVSYKDRFVSWESFASGKAIYKRYGKYASEIDDEKIWKEVVRNFSIGLLQLIATLTPDLVVFGGGVGAHFEKYGKLLNENLKKYETPLLKIPPVMKAKNPEEAVIFGCYEYAKQHAH